MNKIEQKTLYRIIENSILEDKLSHAYLLVGENTLSSAIWLAAALMTRSVDDKLIEERLEAFENGSSVDFILINGNDTTIKKESIIKLQDQFQKTAMEKFNQKVVILHQCHQASISALNSILKFVEEPQGKTTSFIFTTNLLQKVLPTIQSRCMIVNLEKNKSSDWDLVHQEPLFVGYAAKIGETKEAAQSILENKENNEIFDFVKVFLLGLTKQVDYHLVLWQLKSFEKEDLQLFLSIICYILREGLYQRKDYLFDLEKDSQLYLIFNDLLSKINPSTILNLLVDEGSYRIREVLV